MSARRTRSAATATPVTRLVVVGGRPDGHGKVVVETALGGTDPELKETVTEFRADEAAHRDTALENGAEQAPAYRLLSETIKAGCRIAIKLSERI